MRRSIQFHRVHRRYNHGTPRSTTTTTVRTIPPTHVRTRRNRLGTPPPTTARSSTTASNTSGAASSAPTTTTMAASGSVSGGVPIPPPTRDQIRIFSIANALPMIGFGFIDQTVMIQAGNAIDCSIGITFGLSTLTAAAIGQVCSNAAGILFGWVYYRSVSYSVVFSATQKIHPCASLMAVNCVPLPLCIQTRGTYTNHLLEYL